LRGNGPNKAGHDTRNLLKVAAGLALLGLGVYLVAAAAGSPPAAPREPLAEKPARAPAALTAADVEAFLDGLVPLQIQQRDIAGAVVVVVRDGQVLFARGYGYADAAKKIPVSPETTLFRPGSVSKLFTWTAVMQLVEQGKLELDRDVNEYLDFEIPPAFGQPVTLRNIMTHTPGFEDILKNLFVSDPWNIPTLRSYVSGAIPRRIYPPGSTVSYSNYATALAGYVVERVSGRPFAEYVAENIFQPLSMNYATFAQPLPEGLRAHMSQGYIVASRDPRPFELVPAAPAGSLSASGLDMARFMLAHLQQGRYNGAAILRPETVKLMHSRQWGIHPEVNGMALGFYEESRNGQRIIGHGGDTVLFHSDLHLLPDAGVGFFFSQNSAGRGEGSLREAVWHKFLDRYFPFTPPAPPAAPGADEDARAVSGSYIFSRRNDSTFLRSAAVLGSVRIRRREPGVIEISALNKLNGQPKRWQAVAPLTFREVDGQEMVAFRRNADGRMEAMISTLPVFLLQQTGWWQSGRAVLFAFGFALGVSLLALIFWGVGAVLRRRYGRRLELSGRERAARIGARLACAVILLFVLGFVLLSQAGQKNIGMFNSGLDPVLRLLQVAGWLGSGGMLIAFYDAYLCWSSPARGWVARFSSTLLALACVAWFWFALAGNLLNPSLQY
jgi:CubicO group peptidase (beta-lactamase class C family)